MPSSQATALNAALAGRYAIERELGHGGMATVFQAHDLRHHRTVAIKVLRPELAGAIGVDRFLREIRVTAGLQHPNIVTLLDSGTFEATDGTALPWYAMAFVPGESLRDRLNRERQLPIAEALRTTEAAAAALQAAHRHGIVHRDIKPENILIADDHVYVTDFGIAKALIDTGGEHLTSTGLAIGTPTYMSPEQATAEAVDARTDQYSLACVLYEMLAGEPPFTGPTAHAVLARRLTEPPRPIRPVRGAVPDAVDAALLQALERLPADRFPDVQAFVDALRGPRAPSRRAPAPRSKRALLVLAGAAVLVAAVLGGRAVSRLAGNVAAPRDSVAVALYQRGLQAYDRRTPSGAEEAVRSFAAALRRDSTYAEAWAGLADTYVRGYERGFALLGATGDSLLRLALSALDHAVAYDRGNATTLVTRAIVSRRLDPTDVTPAIKGLRQALAMDSTNPVAWHYLAVSLAEAGRLNDALSAWRRSVAAAPSYTMGLAFLAVGHYWRGQFDSAAHWADSAVTVDPTFVLGRTSTAQIAVERGDWARARAALDAARRLTSDVEVANALAGSALVEIRAGDARAARRILQQAESLAVRFSPTPPHTAVYMAQAYAARGDGDRALDWLRRYATPADLHFQLHLRCDPPFAPLNDDPRFRALLGMPRPVSPSVC